MRDHLHRPIPASFQIGADDDSSSQSGLPYSIFDMFSVGIGPSSSHTVGPMRAARQFTVDLQQFLAAHGATRTLGGLTVDLMGSLGATGRGHSTDRAVVLGLLGYRADSVPGVVVENGMEQIAKVGALEVSGVGSIPFAPERDIRFSPRTVLPFHVNALSFAALGSDGTEIFVRTYYSVGGGFVMVETGDAVNDPRPEAVGEAGPGGELTRAHVPHPYSTADELLQQCQASGLSISQLVLENELAWHSRSEVEAYIAKVWEVMRECIDAGCSSEGVLPGVLRVRRRAHTLYKELRDRESGPDVMSGMDWVNLYALAVNEENAAGHRVVTAPTNGAAGVVPAVLMYFCQFVAGSAIDDSFASMDFDDDGVQRFLLAATAIGGLIKANASIAGAEVGCQGEVGSASAMAAAGLAEAMGGTAQQVENAAEIAMEHSLGLTCDPVAGLVQIPCIERNAIAGVKAINAARMSLWGDGRHVVSLDTVVATMRQTGLDMSSKYKETSEGGLAVHVIEC